MKKLYIYILIVTAGFLALSSCMDETGIVWEGLVVEFEAVTGETGGVYLRENDGENIADQIQINLVGAHQTNAVNVGFEIDDTTTAIEGVHYNLISSNTVTIPAGSSFAQIEFEIIDDNIEPGETWLLAFNITSADVDISQNYKSVIHSMAVSCPSDLAGDYSSTMSGNLGDGSGGSSGTYADLGTTVTLTADEESPGVYNIDDMSFGIYPDSYSIDAPPGRIQDICDNLTGLGDTDEFGDPFTITGTVNDDGTITISWSNTYGDSGTGTLTKQ